MHECWSSSRGQGEYGGATCLCSAKVPQAAQSTANVPSEGTTAGTLRAGEPRGSGQSSWARGPSHAGRKEGRGTEGLRKHTPSLFRVVGAAPLLCRGGRGSVLGEQNPLPRQTRAGVAG